MAQNQTSDRGSRHVREFMTTNPQSVTQQDTIRDVARIMKDQDTGVVPVVDGRKIIGMITDRDIVVRGIAEGRDVTNGRVSELMTKQVRSVREDSAVSDVLQLMGNADIRRVPVVNASDELVGIVSIGDISVSTNQDGKVGQTLEDISEAPPNN